MGDRKTLKTIYGDRYRMVNGERGPFYNLCVYCGDPATCRDHYPPLNRISDYESLNLAREYYLLIPSCTHCNSVLGDSLQTTFPERVEALKDKLEAKFTRVQEWDDDEVLELGPTLRSYVAVETAKDQKKQRRIEYYSGLDAVLDALSPVEAI